MENLAVGGGESHKHNDGNGSSEGSGWREECEEVVGGENGEGGL